MRFAFTEEQQRFREEVRKFLDIELPRARERGEMVPGRVRGYSKEFSRALAERGWIGMSWPREYGGRGADSITQMIFTEEMITSGAPCGYHFVAERQVGPSLVLHGTDQQRAEWIPRILRGEVSFCLGLSEPEAGSDLANVQTRATRVGDRYVVTGSKIWSSNAHISDMMWLVVRTNPDVPKHKGISILLLDLKSPGVDIRPLYDMTGEWHFNEVFLTDVEVPIDMRVGPEDRGWYVLAEHLDFERSGIEMLLEGAQWLAECIERLKKDSSIPASRCDRLRREAAQLWIEMEVGRNLCYRVAYMQSTGCIPNHEAAMSKMFGSEWVQRVGRFGLKLASSTGAVIERGYEVDFANAYLRSISRTIAGGTSEIQRNIIATRGLGLPR